MINNLTDQELFQALEFVILLAAYFGLLGWMADALERWTRSRPRVGDQNNRLLRRWRAR